MPWTAGELREELDNYGDHVPVAIVIEKGDSERVVLEFDVGTRHIENEMHVDLTVTD